MWNPTCSEPGCERPCRSAGRCKLHYQQWYRSADYRPLKRGGHVIPIEVRFWRHVDKNGPKGCWLWTGAKARGYGHMRIDGREARAARLSYELFVGPIPPGLHIDHLCRVIACVNPDHLEPVTNAENKRRATAARSACPNGHPYTESNTHLYRGWRTCRECHRLNERKRKAKLRAAA